jgi:23S rRNA (cytidine1920-2'-O)/16S rRNA (cytidine1409-2'-O)-methyltransferase
MKERIDILLVERRLTDSRMKAQWLIRNGYVSVNGVEIRKPGKKVDNSNEILLKKEFPYLGKGGIKLEAALKEFSISVVNKVCADIGASIGGFTDCLLKHGASRVYAIDTADDLLHPSLRCEKAQDKVFPMLGVDARDLKNLTEEVVICTVDVTFTSIRAILPNVRNYLNENGDIISLIKPLFETEFYDVNKFKIIKNSVELRQIIKKLMEWSVQNKFFPYGLIKSPLLGKGGSIEFFIHYRIDIKSSEFNYEKRTNAII